MLLPAQVSRRFGLLALLTLAGVACEDDGGDTNSPNSEAGRGGTTAGGAAGSPASGAGGGASGAFAAGGSIAAGTTQTSGSSGEAGEAGGSDSEGGAAGGSAGEAFAAAGGEAGSSGGAGGLSDGGEGGIGGAAGGDALAPEEVFRPSTRFTLVNPKDHGAVGDGVTDDAGALEAAFAALPAAGGIVLFPEGTYLKAQRQLRITQSHTLLWAPNGRAGIHGTVRSHTQEERDRELCGVRQQAIVFRDTTGGGVYGLHFSSNATERTSCAEDCLVTLDTAVGFELVGTEMNGAAGCGIFAWSSRSGARSEELFVEGNFIHHTYADSVHHTHGARRSHCWNNSFFNEAPSLGDDGIACVTYSPTDPLCGEMEWWDNLYLGGAHGRGMAVIGGEDISIHDNWIIGSASAGLIVASEWAYTSASSRRIELRSNYLLNSPNGSVNNGHSAILISGGNAEADPIREVVAVDNVIIDPANDRVERAEGSYDASSIVFDNSTNPDDLPGPVPTRDDVVISDTSVLRTRDLSFVTAAERRGLYRIHVREAPSGAGNVEERFEYVVRGPAAALDAWLASVSAAGGYLSEKRTLGADGYALLLSPTPLEVRAELSAVSFEELRAGDRDGSLAWLWSRLDEGRY